MAPAIGPDSEGELPRILNFYRYMTVRSLRVSKGNLGDGSRIKTGHRVAARPRCHRAEVLARCCRCAVSVHDKSITTFTKGQCMNASECRLGGVSVTIQLSFCLVPQLPLCSSVRTTSDPAAKHRNSTFENEKKDETAGQRDDGQWKSVFRTSDTSETHTEGWRTTMRLTFNGTSTLKESRWLYGTDILEINFIGSIAPVSARLHIHYVLEQCS